MSHVLSADDFDNGKFAFLVSDVEIECTTETTGVSERHERVKALAWLALVLWAFGLIGLNAVFLFCARRAILAGRSTPLSRATRFLYREYEKVCLHLCCDYAAGCGEVVHPRVELVRCGSQEFFWWELVEMVRRVFLVGIMVLVYRGTVTQLVIGAAFVLGYLLLQLQAAPFHDTGDDYVANIWSRRGTNLEQCCVA